MSQATTTEVAKKAPRDKYDSRRRGIFSIETNWYQLEDATSIRPILQLLRDGYWKVPFISRDAGTSGELFHYIDKWKKMGKQRKDVTFPILYLGFHGSKQGQNWLETESGEQNMVNYEVLGEHLRNSCTNKVIHFAGCSVVKDMKHRKFLKSTGATAVSGYAEDVDCDAYAFEYLYLQYLQYFGQKNLTKNVVENVRDELKERYKKFYEYFGFELHIA